MAQIVEVASQPIHRMADHRVAITNVANKQFELGPVKVLAGGLVHKTLVYTDAFKLTQFLLVKRTDPEIADDLTDPALPSCTVWL